MAIWRTERLFNAAGSKVRLSWPYVCNVLRLAFALRLLWTAVAELDAVLNGCGDRSGERALRNVLSIQSQGSGNDHSACSGGRPQ